MPLRLKTKAKDKSTYIVTASFTDENGDAVVPNAGLKYTLTSSAGTVINSREDIIITPASSVDIVLSGDDLKYDDGAARHFTIEGTFDSGAGNDLPINDEIIFEIEDLLNI